jgi:hypothetical protein
VGGLALALGIAIVAFAMRPDRGSAPSAVPARAPSGVVRDAAEPPAASELRAAPPPQAAPARSIDASTAPTLPPPGARARAAEARTSVSIAITSMPAGAAILVAGKLLGKTPFRGRLPLHGANLKLVVRLTGYLDRTVLVRGDHDIDEDLTLVERTRASPSPRANHDERDDSVNPFDH